MKARASGGGAVSFNMTPMIDIVFNLIIFFMLVSQFYQLKTEMVKLPPAKEADPRRQEVARLVNVVINILPPGTKNKEKPDTTQVYVDGRLIMDSIDNGRGPTLAQVNALEDLLKARREAAEKSGKTMNVILRAGENVRFDMVAKVMIATGTAGINAWWVQAARPSSTVGQDEDLKEFLGVSSTLE
jgi:biopolymer transport protein ExbD